MSTGRQSFSSQYEHSSTSAGHPQPTVNVRVQCRGLNQERTTWGQVAQKGQGPALHVHHVDSVVFLRPTPAAPADRPVCRNRRLTAGRTLVAECTCRWHPRCLVGTVVPCAVCWGVAVPPEQRTTARWRLRRMHDTHQP